MYQVAITQVLQTTTNTESFYIGQRQFVIETIETDMCGHLSWSCTVTDSGNVPVLVMDWDIEDALWVISEGSIVYTSRIQNPLLAARSSLREYA